MTDIISVSESFDGGNIKFVGIVNGEVHVEVKDDIYTELETMYHKQWFYFRASGFSHLRMRQRPSLFLPMLASAATLTPGKALTW